MRSQLTENVFSAEPMPTTATSSDPSQRVFLLDQDVMELIPSPKRMEAFAYILLLIGIATSLYIWFFTDFEARKKISLFVAAWFLAGAVGTLGGCILTRLLGTRVRFDRNAGIIKIYRGRYSSATIFDIDNVVGIQQLYIGKKHIGENSFQTKVYQLNFLVQGDTVERFHLLECGKQHLMQKLAKVSAGFLNIPLFEQECLTQQQPEARAQG